MSEEGSAVTRHRGRAALAACLALLVAIGAGLVVPVASSGAEGLEAEALSRDTLAHPVGPAAAAGTDVTPPIPYGTDGRLTLFLIGSDYRATHGGERTDVMMVLSIDPVSKRVAAASIPRDIVFFPRAPANGGGTTGTQRVNGLYSDYKRHGMPHAKVDMQALATFSKDVAFALGTKIDAFAMVRFEGFAKLVNSIAGVAVDIGAPITDPSYHMGPTRGVFFPKAQGYHLDGNPPCQPKPSKCHSALAYARSRKGTVGDRPNTDYLRARRQQYLVVDGANTIADSVVLSSLAELIAQDEDSIYTNLPHTVDAAKQLIDLFKGSSLNAYRSAVFGPNVFAYSTPQTPSYAYRLRLDRVRGWIDKRFYPVP